MTKKTLITSGKGGVGKSTITVLLGFFLTILGKKVIILDLDFGISSVEECRYLQTSSSSIRIISESISL